MAEMFYCEADGKSFDTVKKLNYHRKTHEENKFACSECKILFATRSGWVTHKLNVHSGKTFSCDKCNKEFMNNTNLQRHIKSDHEKRTYHCVRCGAGFGRKDLKKTFFEMQKQWQPM